MKNKKLILILIATITVIAAATVLSACDKNKGEFVDVGIELYSAKQYYVEGETFTPEGGILKVYSYNEKRRKKNTASSILPTRTLPLKTRRERASIRTPLPQDTKGFRRSSSISCKKKKTPLQVLISCCRKITARLCIRCRIFAVKSIFGLYRYEIRDKVP